MREFHSVLAAAAPTPAAPPVQGAPSAAYLWIPIGVGGGLALLLLLVTEFWGIPCLKDGKPENGRLFDPVFWKARFYASAAWTFGDSGATNITALATAVVAILTADSALSEVFGNVDLNPFIIMNTACGGLVAATPILFGIVNYFVMSSSPAVPADASLALHANATVRLPAGGSIAVPGGATVADAAGGPAKPGVKAGGTIPVAPGSVLTVKSGATLAVPSGTTVALDPGATLWMSTDAQFSKDSLDPPPPAKPDGKRGICRRRAKAPDLVPKIAANDLITVTEGATVTVTGAADIVLPAGTTVVAPGRGMSLKADATLALPCGSNVMAAGMGSILPAAILTTFAAGTEIGLAAVLAVHYSKANSAGHLAAVVIAAVVAAGLLLYGVTAIRSLASPASGTALSSAAGSSFTL